MLEFAKSAAEGVRYLHGSRYFDVTSDQWKDCIIHRDLKPENMLVTNNYTLKLTDFGEARATSNMNLKMTSVGTPIFMAPEVMRSDMYDYKADVYRWDSERSEQKGYVSDQSNELKTHLAPPSHLLRSTPYLHPCCTIT